MLTSRRYRSGLVGALEVEARQQKRPPMMDFRSVQSLSSSLGAMREFGGYLTQVGFDLFVVRRTGKAQMKEKRVTCVF